MNGLTANTLLMITTMVAVPALFLGCAYLFRRIESKERLAAIEKGVYQPPTPQDIRRRTRRAAIALIAGGLGVILAFVIEALIKRNLASLSSTGLGIVPVALGLGLLLDVRLQYRDLMNERSNSARAASDQVR
jgi:hypothetical protein